jgi:RNA polymerase sigma-70 factor (ECF subfamily)
MSDDTDEGEIAGLLDRVQQGDQDALAALFSKHRERLRRLVEFRLDARLNGRISTSDVLQEAYIDALKRLPHFREELGMPFFIWLRWVTLQRVVEVHRQHLGARKRDAGKEISIGRDATISASSVNMSFQLVGELTSPSQAAQRGEMMAQLQKVLERMDPIDREVLALRHFEELSNTETASLLGIQSAAASKRYVRALERLKDALARLPGFVAG